MLPLCLGDVSSVCRVLYTAYAGGVSAMSNQTFFRINGYPNLYWGWGGEDDDFSARSNFIQCRKFPNFYCDLW